MKANTDKQKKPVATRRAKKTEFKPAFTVDITGAETGTEVLAAYGVAKQEAGLPMTKEELTAIIDIHTAPYRDAANAMLSCFLEGFKVAMESTPKKENFFKRMWKKIF